VIVARAIEGVARRGVSRHGCAGKQGIPSVAVATERFESLARLVAGSLGRPFTQLAVIPHPLGGLTQEQVYRKAEAALPEIVKRRCAR